MEKTNDEPIYEQYPGEAEAQKHYKFKKFGEIIYKFFYNIWPTVNRVLSFFFYHILRVIKGSFKIAMEQLHQS